MVQWTLKIHLRILHPGGRHDIWRKAAIPSKGKELDPGTAGWADRHLPAGSVQMGAGHCHTGYRACGADQPAVWHIHRCPAAGRCCLSSLCCQSGQLLAALGTAGRRSGSRTGLHRAADPGDLCLGLSVRSCGNQAGPELDSGLHRAFRVPAHQKPWLAVLSALPAADWRHRCPVSPQLQRLWKKLRQRFARKETLSAEE